MRSRLVHGRSNNGEGNFSRYISSFSRIWRPFKYLKTRLLIPSDERADLIMRRFTTAAETVHNSGGETTGNITTPGGEIPSRRRRKIDAAAPASPRKMAIPAGRNFASCYMELCKQQRLRPLPVICVTLPHSLDFTTDRVKMDDWGPILNSLSLDRSLKSISVHSRLQNN